MLRMAPPLTGDIAVSDVPVVFLISSPEVRTHRVAIKDPDKSRCRIGWLCAQIHQGAH